MSSAAPQQARRSPGALRESFIERTARDRARCLLDAGSFRELLGPFDRLESPWLPMQGITPQADDGVVVARGRIDGRPAVVLAIEGAFQGGSIGEVSGAKIAGSLELCLAGCESGSPVVPVLVLESGGVRLQEANLGLAAVAEIHSAIIALRTHVPVVAVIAGIVGCFGGMSLAAALCSYVIMTRQARLGMNGPEVIEQEAGVAELDARDRPLVWGAIGGQQRFETGFVDSLVPDDAAEVRRAVGGAVARGPAAQHRSTHLDQFLGALAAINPAELWQPADVRRALANSGTTP